MMARWRWTVGWAVVTGNLLLSSGAPGADSPTFSRDIAPILFSQCVVCHRPGQSGPFTLLTYDEARKRHRQIAEVTTSRAMPPWLPEPGFGDFSGVRRLTPAQIDLIRTWSEAGAPEGDPGALPAAPQFPDGWQLGRPDLILTPPRPFILPADGRDVYRNLVIPIPGRARRYVQSVEIHPGTRAVHHAFVRVDATDQSRKLAEKETEPGFPGMNTPESAQMPAGHFLGWQPGRVPQLGPPGLAWTLEPGSTLVIQLHLNPIGKAEPVQPSVALYFTDQPPTNSLYKFTLTSLGLDIPAGATNYQVRDTYQLPVDVDLVAVLPHTHYLGKRLEGTAVLPGGRREPLLLIKDWDFNWQGDYRYARPLALPKGTILEMNYSFDNSTNNIRNPNHPPKRVRYGPQSTDEMAELWFQVLPRNLADRAALDQDYQRNAVHFFLDLYGQRVADNPRDLEALTALGETLMMAGRYGEAETRLRAAIAGGDTTGEPHYFLGITLQIRNRLPEAKIEFEAALRLNPNKSRAHGYLGYLNANLGDLAAAERHFRSALQLDPGDQLARQGLERVQQTKSTAPGSK